MGAFVTQERQSTTAAGRTVATDLDGILLDGMQFHIAAWHAAFADYAVTLDEHDLYLLEGIKTKDVVDRLSDIYQLDLSTEARASIVRTKKETYREIFRPLPLDGAGNLLETFRECGYSIAIVTGTVADAATATLDALGMSGGVQHIISSDLNIPGKPDPAPFREAATRLGVPPSFCLAIDNAPAGVSSAVTAGLPCAGVATYLTRDDLRKADATFDNVQCLARWLRSEYETSNGSGPWTASLPPRDWSPCD